MASSPREPEVHEGEIRLWVEETWWNANDVETVDGDNR